MNGNTLRPTPGTLLVFIDEAGDEDYSDPKNPTFGRGGCAVRGAGGCALSAKDRHRMAETAAIPATGSPAAREAPL